MEYLDKLIPLTLLGVIGAVLVILSRRKKTEALEAPRVEEPFTAAPLLEDTPQEPTVPKQAPAVIVRTVVPEIEPVAIEPVPTIEDLVAANIAVAPVRKLPTSPQPLAAAQNTPIQAVRKLLTNKDSLAVAFVLREVLGPPVSKRQA